MVSDPKNTAEALDSESINPLSAEPLHPSSHPLQSSLPWALSQVESALRALKLWNEDDAKIPSPQAFLSTVPFCLDTMPFEHWLQYVLLPRLASMLQAARQDAAVMDNLASMKLAVHPAAEEYWRGQWREYRGVLLALRRLDELFEKAGD